MRYIRGNNRDYKAGRAGVDNYSKRPTTKPSWVTQLKRYKRWCENGVKWAEKELQKEYNKRR